MVLQAQAAIIVGKNKRTINNGIVQYLLILHHLHLSNNSTTIKIQKYSLSNTDTKNIIMEADNYVRLRRNYFIQNAQIQQYYL